MEEDEFAEEDVRSLARRTIQMKMVSDREPSKRDSNSSRGTKRTSSTLEQEVQQMKQMYPSTTLSEESLKASETDAMMSEEDNEKEMSDTVSDSDSEVLPDVTFCISDTELSRLMSRTSIKTWVINAIRAKTDYMPLSEFEKVVKKLYKCSLKSITDLHELHLRRMLALPLINDIIQRADPEYISTAHIIHMVWSVMSCLHHFQLRLRSGSNKIILYTRQRIVDKCMDYYLQLIKMFKPKMHRFILSAIITFYKEGKLWDIEFACTDMIAALLDIYPDVEEGVNDLLNSAIFSTAVNTTEAQKLMQVIYEVLKLVNWPKISRKFIDRLILMLESSIAPRDETEHIYMPLRMGIDLCIRHIINNISNTDVMIVLKRLLKRMVHEEATDEIVLNFGNLAAYAASTYKMKSFYVNLTPDLLSNISVLAHDDREGTLLAITKIWLNLTDRNKNLYRVNRPKIFFRESNYKITIKKKVNLRDRVFFKAHRNFFYELITYCFKNCKSRVETNAIFAMCAVILVEIPCGYTAATFTSIAMSMQEYALKISSTDLAQSHHLHASALAILSLICYIHKAEVFYDYVIKIVDGRAEWAPHLIPPLRSKYEYALHHVLWNKPDLFFEDWETRYGLWKCFRIKKKKEIKTVHK